MKFAHMADVHIGSFRDPKLRNLSTEAFRRAIDQSINEGVDFVLISGDLLNTALPGIELIKDVVVELKKLKKQNIPCYIIPGSHDFSPSGKTMLDVLEHAELCTNVFRGFVEDGVLSLTFTQDKKTGAKITGILGLRGTLEKQHYERLDHSSLALDGFKIFLLHSALEEVTKKKFSKMQSTSLTYLPKGFNYYAGGHVHMRKHVDKSIEGFGHIVYPGPIFPANFSELEELKHGGFYLYDNGAISFRPIELYPVLSATFDVHGKHAEVVSSEIKEHFSNLDCKGKIITIRVKGVLEQGRPSEVDFKSVYQYLNEKGAFFIMKNTKKMVAKEFQEVKTEMQNVETIEEDILRAHLGQFKLPGISPDEELAFLKSYLQALDLEKDEGERMQEYEERIKKTGMHQLRLD